MTQGDSSQSKDVSKKKIDLSKISLYLILFLLQICSLYTTVKGVQLLLTDLKIDVWQVEIPAYWFLGTGIQLFILWLFLFGKHALRSRFTLWLLVLVYSSLSIYTSFFAFYEGFSGEILSDKTESLKKRDEIISSITGSDVYRKEERKYFNLEESLKNSKNDKAEESKSGQGPNYNKAKEGATCKGASKE